MGLRFYLLTFLTNAWKTSKTGAKKMTYKMTIFFFTQKEGREAFPMEGLFSQKERIWSHHPKWVFALPIGTPSYAFSLKNRRKDVQIKLVISDMYLADFYKVCLARFSVEKQLLGFQ